MTTFKDLGLSDALLATLEREGYHTPTPIQAKAIPLVLSGGDMIGIAQTGTGKTAAFALPILQKLAENRRPAMRKGARVLVLSPTRELATQIADSFKTYGKTLNMTVATVFGGVSYKPQIQALTRGLDVLVATPGRLMDHLEQRTVSLEGVEMFVLDEADQMLDLGFVKPIRKIASGMSVKRQSLFFSATMPPEIRKLANELLHNPAEVSVAPAATTVERVEQRVIQIERTKKRALLVELLGGGDMSRTLIFTRTKRGADRVAKSLEVAGVSVGIIHGDKSQQQRQRALELLRSSQIQALVATDIAARGIDIDGVTHVVNYELPDVPESYVHRIGRTARAGATGMAISLVDKDEQGQLRDIERVTRQKFIMEDRRTDAGLVAAPESADERGQRRPMRSTGRSDGPSRAPRSTPRAPRAEGSSFSRGPSPSGVSEGSSARPQTKSWAPRTGPERSAGNLSNLRPHKEFAQNNRGGTKSASRQGNRTQSR